MVISTYSVLARLWRIPLEVTSRLFRRVSLQRRNKLAPLREGGGFQDKLGKGAQDNFPVPDRIIGHSNQFGLLLPVVGVTGSHTRGLWGCV